MTSAQIWQLNQEENARGAEPLANFSALMTGRSLANLARSQQLQDIASQRQFTTQEQEQASKRRMAERAEDERLLAARQAAGEGIPGIDQNSSLADIASAKQRFLGNKASVQLDILDAQRSEAQQKQQRLMNEAIQSVYGGENDDPRFAEARREALQSTLAGPSARVIPQDVRNQLQSILANNQDPRKAVNDTVRFLQDRGLKYIGWLVPGYHTPDEAFSQASNFFNAYKTALDARVGTERQAELAVKLKAFDDANKQAEALNQQAWAHIGANAAFLPKETIQEWTSKNGPPANPNSVFSPSDLSKPPGTANPNPSQYSTPAGPPNTQAPAMPAPGAPANSGASVLPSFGPGGSIFSPTINTFRNPSPAPPLPISDESLANIAGMNRQVPALSGIRVNQPISRNDLATFAINKSLAGGPAGQPGSALIPASPAEKAQVESLVRFGLKAKGFSDDQVEDFIAKGNQGVASGDPQAIATANQLLKMVRVGSAAPPASPVQTGSNFPSSAPLGQQ